MNERIGLILRIIIGISSVVICVLIWMKIIPLPDGWKEIPVALVGLFAAPIYYFIDFLIKKGSNGNKNALFDTRIKDAAMLLAANNTSTELSGIYALHQIAKEASKTKDQKEYVKVIKNILIAFIKENSVIEYQKNRKGEILLDELEMPIVKKAYNKKNDIVLQTIINILFSNNSWKTYAEYPTNFANKVLSKEIEALNPVDLSKTVLKGINFSYTKLPNVNFSGAQLQDAYFGFYSLLVGANFSGAQLQNANFWLTSISNANFKKAALQNVNFAASYFIDKAIFGNTLWNENTNFIGTAFENKTLNQLTEIMGNPPVSNYE